MMWVHGMASVPQDALTPPLGNTIGYLSIPVFTMDRPGCRATTHPLPSALIATAWPDLWPVNSVANASSSSATPIIPIIGFSLLTSTAARPR